MYCDGYSFQGEGVTKGRGFRDPPPRKKRNGRGGGPGGFSGSSAVKDAAMLMDPFAKGLKSKFGKEGDEREPACVSSGYHDACHCVISPCPTKSRSVVKMPTD